MQRGNDTSPDDIVDWLNDLARLMQRFDNFAFVSGVLA